MIDTSTHTNPRPDFENMTAAEVETYEAETDRVFEECREASRESRSLVAQARALRPMADRWLYLPSQGYKCFGDFTAADIDEAKAHYTSSIAVAKVQAAALQAELERRGAA
jgi:hypothetical protein